MTSTISVQSASRLCEKIEANYLRLRDEAGENSIAEIIFDCCAQVASSIRQQLVVQAQIDELKEKYSEVKEKS